MKRLTKTMQAAAIDRFGGADEIRLETLPVPRIGPDEVLIRVESAGVAHSWDRPASLVDVDVRVAGRGAPLYPAPDGSGRLYVEARPGAEYDVVVRNRSAGRVGVVLVVDGLNVVSGERGREREDAGDHRAE